jgi:hypothetical protein
VISSPQTGFFWCEVADAARAGRRGIQAEVLRVLGVIEDQLTVERVELVHVRLEVRTDAATASRRTSTSSGVLYRAVEARTDAVTP